MATSCRETLSNKRQRVEIELNPIDEVIKIGSPELKLLLPPYLKFLRLVTNLLSDRVGDNTLVSIIRQDDNFAGI